MVGAEIGTALRRLAVGPARRVIVDPGGKRLWIAGGSRGRLEVVDKVAWRREGEVQTGGGVTDAAVAP
jgi:hypothetical protein